MAKRASMCDMTAGWNNDPRLALEIDANTKTEQEKQELKDAIKKAIEELGYVVDWIPSL